MMTPTQRAAEAPSSAGKGTQSISPVPPKSSPGRSFGDVLHGRSGRADDASLESGERSAPTLRGRLGRGVRADGTQGSDDETLTPFRMPASVLLAPTPLSRPSLAASGSMEGARAIADRIVEAARVETGRPGHVELVMRTRDEVLGGLEVRVRMEHGIIHATFATAQPEVRATLEAQAGALRECLLARGLVVGDIHVAEGRAPTSERERERERQRERQREQTSDGGAHGHPRDAP